MVPRASVGGIGAPGAFPERIGCHAILSFFCDRSSRSCYPNREKMLAIRHSICYFDTANYSTPFFALLMVTRAVAMDGGNLQRDRYSGDSVGTTPATPAGY
jgi:hypothetical protein